MKKKSKTINVSIIIFVVLVLSFCAIIAKLSFVALAKKVDGMDLTEFVKNRNTETVTLKAQRGSIYSIDGELLAKNVNAYTVIAYLSPSRTKDIENPKHVVDKDRTAEELSKVLGGDKEYYLQRLNVNAYQVEFGVHGKGITELVKKQIEALDLPGIDFIPTSKRTYQMGSFASYLIGFASADDDGSITGKMGIEAYFDNELQGKDGYTIYQKDAMGYTIPNTTPITVEAESGKDVYLTIDSKIQMFVENGISDISKDNEMTWLTFTVMDAKTGAIVASASNPTFNLNTRQAESYLNPLTQYSYEPGSTMKIFSFMAAMENGMYNGNDTYASGTIQVDDARIKDFNGVGWGTITFDSGFAYSSNVAATNLALKMGRERLYNFYHDIGFGQKTGITLPGEVNGSINFIYKSELATASFGQGIVTTPVQQIQALSILTNEGVELQPYIVDRIVDSETGEVVYKHQRTELGKKASKETTDKLLSLMYDVVYSGKTDAKFYKTDSVKLVGKTGTAEFVGPDGRYLTGDYNYVRSFAGIFPYDDPQYIIYVSVKQYQGSYKEFAGMVSNVVEEIAKYKNISEQIDKIDSSKIIEMDNYVSSYIIDAADKLQKERLAVVVMGSGKYVVKQYPPKGKKILVGNKVFLISESNEYIMPDVIGWSSNEIFTLCKLLGIKYTTSGYGKVVGTNIETGAVINSETQLEITLG